MGVFSILALMKAGKVPFLQKVLKPHQPEVKTGPDAWNAKYGGHRMVISTPKDIAEEVSLLPKGQVIRISALRERLAVRHEGDYTCPLTTGIFLNLVAHAMEEPTTGAAGYYWPYWRVVRDDGQMMEKFPGGIEAHRTKLEAEGHSFSVDKRGKMRVNFM